MIVISSLCWSWPDHHAHRGLIIMLIMTWSLCSSWPGHYADHDLIVTWSLCWSWPDRDLIIVLLMLLMIRSLRWPWLPWPLPLQSLPFLCIQNVFWFPPSYLQSPLSWPMRWVGGGGGYDLEQCVASHYDVLSKNVSCLTIILSSNLEHPDGIQTSCVFSCTANDSGCTFLVLWRGGDR